MRIRILTQLRGADLITRKDEQFAFGIADIPEAVFVIVAAAEYDFNRFSDLRFEIPDECYDEKLFQETLSRLSETYGVSLTGIDRILSVGVHTEVQDPSGTVQDDYFSYLVGKIGTTWYVLE